MAIYINAEQYPDTLDQIFDAMDSVEEQFEIVNDKLGDYWDWEEEETIGGLIEKIGKRSTGQLECYPKWEATVQIQSSGTAWWAGTKFDIVGAIKYLDIGDAVDYGFGLVRFNSTAHGLFPGETIVINGTTNYDGTYTIDENGSIELDWFQVQTGIDFIAETFDGSETVIDQITNTHIIEGIHVVEISAVGEYELILWQGSIGEEVEIGRIPLFKTATEASEGIINFKTDWLTTGRISASLLSSNAAANTVNIKLLFRESSGTGWA